MRTIISLFLLAFLPFFALGQPVLDALNKSEREIDRAHSVIKDFRDGINSKADNPDNSRNDYAFSEYLKVFSELSTSIHIRALKNSDLGADSILNLNYQWTTKQDSFRNTVKILDLAEHYYEPLAFEIYFPTISDTIEPNTTIEALIKNYNLEVESVGRRMGRILQSACIEDDDYVTQQSYTRLDLALSDLKIAELHLRNAVNELAMYEKYLLANRKKDTIVYIEVEPLPTNSWFMYASSDLKDNLGAGVLWHLNKVDLGFDAFFVFQTEGGIQFHPKVGLPVNDFHFLAGMLMEVSAVNQFTYEYTGNIYYTNNNFIGGLSFSRNRILFSVGWRIM